VTILPWLLIPRLYRAQLGVTTRPTRFIRLFGGGGRLPSSVRTQGCSRKLMPQHHRLISSRYRRSRSRMCCAHALYCAPGTSNFTSSPFSLHRVHQAPPTRLHPMSDRSIDTSASPPMQDGIASADSRKQQQLGEHHSAPLRPPLPPIRVATTVTAAPVPPGAIGCPGPAGAILHSSCGHL